MTSRASSQISLEAAAELELALAIGSVGSAALLTAGIGAVAAPAVGKLGAISPVGEYHSSEMIPGPCRQSTVR